MAQIRCTRPNQPCDSEHPHRSHATPALACDICGTPAAVEDFYGIRLCGPHAVEAAGLEALSDQIRWDLTPVGAVAVNHPGAELCPSCGAPAGFRAGRPTCLWPRHRNADSAPGAPIP